MSNLFSIFNPESISFLNLNWLEVLVFIFLPSRYWVIKSKYYFFLKRVIIKLEQEFKSLFRLVPTLGITFILVSLFMFIFFNNFLSLFPFIFSTRRHFCFTLRLAFPFWFGFIIYSIISNFKEFLAHLVPVGTPYALIAFMVVIEVVSNLTRPISLSVRLAANITAGHILISVISTSIIAFPNIFLYLFVLLILLLFFILELSVSVIQAYVFRTLRSIYILEVNIPNL